jgi:hypothetical protein
MFEKCVLFNYKTQYLAIKDDLLKSIKNLETEFLKLKKENEIEDNLSKEEKEKKLKILKEFENRYESISTSKGNHFKFLQKIIHSGSILDFFEFCNMSLLNFEKSEHLFLELKIIFPLIHFYESYIKDKKYKFLIYKNTNEKIFAPFKYYNNFQIKIDGADYNKKKCLQFLEKDEKEIINLFIKFETDINEKCDMNNFVKKKKFTYQSSFSFIPQVEIKFNDVNEITKELIDDLKLKLNKIFQGKEIKIIKLQKGSLDVAIALNYLIQESLNEINIDKIPKDKFFEKLNESLNIRTGDIKNMLQDNLVIAQMNKEYKPTFVNENLLDLTTEESQDK